MFNTEKRAVRAEAKVQRLEDQADEKTEKALRNLRSRRAWVVTKMSLPSGSIGGHQFNDDLAKAAQELFYLDSAIRALAEDD